MESLHHLYKIGHGPSSSHTMGPESACKYILKNYININKIIVTLYGSLALTGKGHLTDKIILETLKNIETEIKFNFDQIPTHPNTMEFDLFDVNGNIVDKLTFYSIGGGNIVLEGETKKINNKDIYPFKSFDEIKKYCLENNLSLYELVLKYEGESILNHLEKVYDVMENSITNGLTKKGELPGGLHVLRKAAQLYNSIELQESSDISKVRLVSSYAFAVSEENASGGLIVTAPTCGACGVVPASLLYVKQNKGLTKQKAIEALAVAGIIGNVIKHNASISGAFAGCQSEIGSACSMAAAAIAYLNSNSIEEIEYAAEIALEHHLGLTCDPVNGLVQIPCIERNAVAAIRAIDSAKLAKFLNGTRKISFDTVVKTMYETGKDLNHAYKETSIGGLAKNYIK